MGKVFDNKYVDSPHFPLAAIAVLACYAMYVLVGQHSDYLYAIQDFSPWMGTSDFFNQFIGHPGGLREWLGCFLTQFFYYPWLGALMLVICWSLSAWMFVKSFKLSGLWSLMALVPEIALLSSITDLGYVIFSLKTVSYWFGPTLGLLMVAGLVRLSLLFEGRAVYVCIALLLAIATPLIGWYAALAVVVAILARSFREIVSDYKYVALAVVPSSAIVWLFYYNSPSVNWDEFVLFYGFHHVVNDVFPVKLLDIPFWVMAFSVVAMPLLSRLQSKRFLSVIPVSLLVLSMFGANMLNYRNENFMAGLRMLRAMDSADWDSLLQEMSRSSIKRKPTRAMVMMKDIALAQKGRLGDEAFDYQVGGVVPRMNLDFPLRSSFSVAPLVYYWLGVPGLAYNHSLFNYVEFGMSPFYMRTIYRIFMVNGELDAARKYKALLGTTLFHSDFQITEDEIDNVRRFMIPHADVCNDGGFYEKFLLWRVCQETYPTAEAQQLAVHFAILSRNEELFLRNLDRYKVLRGDTTDNNLPKYFNINSFRQYYETNTGNKVY